MNLSGLNIVFSQRLIKHAHIQPDPANIKVVEDTEVDTDFLRNRIQINADCNDKTTSDKTGFARIKKTPSPQKSGKLLCVQEVVTPIYIMSYYINWGNCLLDTLYV